MSTLLKDSKLAGFVVLCCLGITAYGAAAPALAQDAAQGSGILGPDAGAPVAAVRTAIDLSQVTAAAIAESAPAVEVPLRELPLEGAPAGDASALQGPSAVATGGALGLRRVPRSFAEADPNFDGIAFGDPGAGFTPPDPNGDVGPDHFVQAVNAAFAIFDKQGNTLVAPMPINTLFADLGGPCATGSVIDPIVNYDPIADRWLVMGFPFASPICVAVSQSGDPVAGGWFLYAFDVSAFGFPDYPKLGVWPDGYYLATQRGFAGGGLDVYALERERMLDGDPAGLVHFFVNPPSLFLLPADLDGRAPRPGTPAPLLWHVDGDLWGGVDRLEVFEFSVDFQNPLSSTLGLVAELPTDPFNAVLCGSNFFGNCAEQPNGVQVETLPAWLMWRVQYRNFGFYETLVANHTVNVDGLDHAGIRWYELRRRKGFPWHKTGGDRPWTIHQQGDFAPQDPAAASFLHRWMGSIAMDNWGNIALGFSASSSDVFPGVRYVGRLFFDQRGTLPRGRLPDGDLIMFEGTGSQLATRWGDYSSMSVDPVDGCTFWYTQQYIGDANTWRTRIGAFRFRFCRRWPHAE